MAKIPLRAYTNEIESIIEQEQTEEAIAHCRHILQVYPKHIDTYRLLGKAYLESRRYGNAANIFERVLSAIPYDFVGHVGMSITRENEGNLDEAIWHMERAFEGQPYNTAIQGELRRLYGKRDGMEPPKIHLTRAALARMYAKGNLFQQAIAELRAAIAEDPNRIDLQVFLAKMYLQSGENTKAIETCGKIIRKLPYCFDANQMLVQLLVQSGRTDESKVYKKRIQELDPYQAHINPNIPDWDHVQDQAVLIEQLIWDGGPAVISTDQPEWATEVGVSINDSETTEEELPDWMDNSTGDSPFFPEKVEDGNFTIEDELIPDFMKDAGWGPSTGVFDESKSIIDYDEDSEGSIFADEAVEGELPDWLQHMAPSDNFIDSEHQPNVVDELIIDETTASSDIFGDDTVEEIPDWLTEMDDQPMSELGSEEVPDWLKDAAEITEAKSDDTDMPDWLVSATLGAAGIVGAAAAADIHNNEKEENDTTVIDDEWIDVDEIPDWLIDVEKEAEAVAETDKGPGQSEDVDSEEVFDEREIEEVTSKLDVDVDVSEPIVDEAPDEGEELDLPVWVTDVEIEQDQDQTEDNNILEWIQDVTETQESLESVEEGTSDLSEELDHPEWLMEDEQDVKSLVDDIKREQTEEVIKFDSSKDIVEEPTIKDNVEMSSVDDDVDLPDWLTPATVGAAGIISAAADTLNDHEDDELGSSSDLDSTVSDQPDNLIESEIDQDSFSEEGVDIPDWIQHAINESDVIEDREQVLAEEPVLPSWITDAIEEQESNLEHDVGTSQLESEVIGIASDTEIPLSDEKTVFDDDSSINDLVAQDNDREISDQLMSTDGLGGIVGGTAIAGDLIDVIDDESSAPMYSTPTDIDQIPTDETVTTDRIKDIEEFDDSDHKSSEAEQPVSEEELGSSIDFGDPDSALAWLENLAAKQGISEEELLTSPEDRSDTPPDWVQKIVDDDSFESELEIQLPLDEHGNEETEESVAEDWIPESDQDIEEESVSAGSIQIQSDWVEDAEEELSFEAIEIDQLDQPEKSQLEDDTNKWVQEIIEDETPVELEKLEETFIVIETPQTELGDSDIEFTWLEDLDSQQEMKSERAQISSEVEIDGSKMENLDATLELPEFLQDATFASVVDDKLEDLDDLPSTSEVSIEPDFDDVDAAMAWLESLAAQQGVSEDELLTNHEDRSETPPNWVQEPPLQETPQSERIDETNLDTWIAEIPKDTTYSDSENILEIADNLAANPVEEIVDEPAKDSDAEFGDVDAAMAWLESLAAKQGVSEDELLTNPEDRSEIPPDWIQQATDAHSIPTLLSPQEDTFEELEQIDVSLAPQILDDESITSQNEEDISYEPPSWITDGQVPEDEDLSWLPTEVSDDETQLLDLNEASLIQLERLPGIGFRRAQSITAFREEHGDFASLDSLMNVPGMDHDTLELLKKRVTIHTSEQGLGLDTIQQTDIFDPLDVEPDDALHELQLAAQAKLNDKKVNEAMEDYREIINKSQRINAVIDDLVKAFEKYPEEASIAQTLGDAYLNANRLQDALEAYTKAQNLLE